MPHLTFTVDSRLLEELGKRLVGKPYIALAELVKNAYDADATKVTIEFAPSEDRIAIQDNGHGMTFEEFRDFWMRVGSRHKEDQHTSRHLERIMTGSKGIGRLAVQLLARKLELTTVGEARKRQELRANVDWQTAVQAGDLTAAKVECKLSTSGARQKGTRIVLTGLNHPWTQEDVIALAQEIWWLRPPFRAPREAQKSFDIKFKSPEAETSELFDLQMKAILEIWHAAVAGRNTGGKVKMAFFFAGSEPVVHEFSIPNCQLRGGDFAIRIFHLKYRQPHGIKVHEARQYFNQYGGVHVYDGGFHLPFYGTPDNDWLRIQWEQAQRISRSKLLPPALQVPEGLNYLPTLSRVFGVVNVSTAEEPDLNMMITRDRLEDNKAFRDLAYMVRYALHFYAMQEAKRAYEAKADRQDIVPATEKFERVEDVLVRHRSQIPKKVYHELKTGVTDALVATESEAEARASQLGLLGSLATAGICSLAYQHELKRQFSSVDDIVERLRKARVKNPRIRRLLNDVRTDLSDWLQRARATNSLFAYLADAENVQTKRRFTAKRVVEEVWDQVNTLARGATIDCKLLDENLRLPKASLAEWGATFQNVFINAFNAMMDADEKHIQVGSRVAGKKREILVQDTGVGVDLNGAEELFRPLVRRLNISPERQALAYGGSGLGLTIVRLVAGNIGAQVSFVEPSAGFSTAFALSWREK